MVPPTSISSAPPTDAATLPAISTLSLAFLDYAILIAYLVAMLWIGFRAARKKSDAKSYFAAGGHIPTWAVGMSILATIISSVTFIGYPGTAYAGNWLLLVQGLMVPVVLLATIWFIVPVYRRSIGISAYEYFERRFSYGARLYTSLAFSVLHFTKLGTVIYLPSLAIARLTNISEVYIILIMGSATILYTLIGGMESVIWTDVVQGFLFLAGGIACILVLLFKPEGGPANVLSTAWNGGKISFAPFDLDFTKRTFIVVAINGVFYALQKYATDQTVVQRYLINKTDKGAIKATLIGGLLCVPAWMMFMLIGSLVWGFYKITHLALPIDPETAKAIAGDKVFPYFITTQLPVGITGLVLAALLAAAMSTISSDLNSLSAVVTEDYYRRLFPTASDKSRLFMSKVFVGIAGILGMGVALFYLSLNNPAILDTIFELYAHFSGGLVGLFALAFFTRRANWQGVFFGIAATVLFCAWGVLTSKTKAFGTILDLNKLCGVNYLNFPHDGYMLQVYPHFVMFIVGYIASLFFPAPQLESERFTLAGYLASRRAEKELAAVGDRL